MNVDSDEVDVEHKPAVANGHKKVVNVDEEITIINRQGTLKRKWRCC